jgi:glyoxylase-like metal-dependent hydrolase (beta-lactamase superfamily II)
VVDYTSEIVSRSKTQRTGVRFGWIASFANVFVVETPEGLVLTDCGSAAAGPMIIAAIRQWSSKHVHTIIYTHGHFDHALAADQWQKNAESLRHPPINLIGHDNIIARFNRYNLTNGYNARINQRQFQTKIPFFPTNFVYPTATFSNKLDLVIGGVTFNLHHFKGETDDAVIVHLREYGIVATGDMFISTMPNCGNPQKVSRYLLEWRDCLDWMAQQRPEYLFPGHGSPIIGNPLVHEALTDTSAFLTSIFEQFIVLFNQNKPINEIIHTVKAPTALLEKKYLRPIYDDPEFLVRNLYRLYGGWYTGVPSELKPARTESLSREIVSLIDGKTEALVTRAESLLQRAAAAASSFSSSSRTTTTTTTNANATSDKGSEYEDSIRLACHLIDLAFYAADDSNRPRILRTREKIYKFRASVEPSLMAKSIFVDAASAKL